jgi:C4-dicarboxylate-specific signal transduction histidine kinase
MNYEKELEKINEETNNTLEELQVTQSHLVQSEKMASLGTLTSGIVHEINNPLNYVAGGLEIMLNTKRNIEKYTIDQLLERFTKSSEIIEAGLDKAVNVVKSLVSFSYGVNPEKETVTLTELFDNTMTFLRSKISDDIQLNFDIDQDVKVHVFKAKIQQVFLNVLENAVIAVQPNKQEKIIRVSGRSENEAALIEIFNNGPKISEANLPKLFDPFFTTREPGRGVGLGLSISYANISDHDGSIKAENLDDGVVFIIKIPFE